jgi:hypothetical protein
MPTAISTKRCGKQFATLIAGIAYCLLSPKKKSTILKNPFPPRFFRCFWGVVKLAFTKHLTTSSN